VIRWLILLLALAGCMETKTDSTSDTSKNDQIVVQGVFSYPSENGPVPVPVNLTITRSGSETKQTQSKSTTQLDTAAIGQQLGAIVSAAISKATGFQMAPAPQSPWMPSPQTAGAVGALGLWAVREMMVARAHKKDADAGWDEALRTAKKARPEDLKGDV
jgi:hypothetical protein